MQMEFNLSYFNYLFSLALKIVCFCFSRDSYLHAAEYHRDPASS